MDSVKTAYCSYLQTAAGARTYNEFKRLLYTGIDSLVEVLGRDVIDQMAFLCRDSLRVCDIGGGDGRRISSILGHMHEQYQNTYELDFIEQSSVYTDAFKDNPVGEFCRTQIHNNLFEETDLPYADYDLVLLIHSIFAFDNGQSVDRVLALRKPEGRVIVVSNAPNSFLGGLKKLVDEDFSDQRYEIDNLEDSLASRGMSCFRFSFATTFSLDSDVESTEVQTLLEWITLGRFAGFSDLAKNGVYEYLRASSSCVAGRMHFREDEVVLVIPDKT